LMDFSITKTIIGVGIGMIVTILPPWGVLFTKGFSQLFFLAAVSTRICLSFFCTKTMKVSGWNVVGVFISPYINGYVALKSAYLTIKNKGIRWRGTDYSLQELKGNENVLARISGKD